MSFLPWVQTEFLKPPDNGNLKTPREDEPLVDVKKPKQQASVYDAVAGTTINNLYSSIIEISRSHLLKGLHT